MRDIRDDLQERLGAIDQELHLLDERSIALNKEAEMLRALLQRENHRWHGAQPSLFTAPVHAGNGNGAAPARTLLSKMVIEALADQRWHDVSEIAAAVSAKGYEFGEKAPGRVLHFALLGMRQSGVVKRSKQGRWRLKQPDEETLTASQTEEADA